MYLITYFKYLHFNYLTTLQTNTQNNIGFSHAVAAAHSLYLNIQNCAWFGRQLSVICCEHTISHVPHLQILATPL